MGGGGGKEEERVNREGSGGKERTVAMVNFSYMHRA